MLESLNGSVPALQANSHSIQIHGLPVPPYIFNQCRPGRSARATKTNVFIGKFLLFGPLTESTRMTAPTYTHYQIISVCLLNVHAVSLHNHRNILCSFYTLYFIIIHSSILIMFHLSCQLIFFVKHSQAVPESERQGPIDGYTVIYNQAGSTMTTDIDVDASDFSIDILGNFVCRSFLFALLILCTRCNESSECQIILRTSEYPN